MKVSTKRALLISPVAALALAGCAVADPDPSQMALHYSGGPFSSQSFVNCVEPGVRESDSPNDTHLYYPVGQRTFTFSTAPGAEAPPIEISTRNQTTLLVSGAITFTLDTDCSPYKEYRPSATPGGKPVLVRTWPGGLIQRFNDTIGRHTNAYSKNGGEAQPAGWDDDVANYIGGPLKIAMNNAALMFDWQQLNTDAVAKNQWQAQVEAQLQTLVDQQAGARHFVINNVQLGKPDLSNGMRAELENFQNATIRGTTADIDKRTAANFPGGIIGYTQYQLQLALAKAINGGQVRVIPIPTGSIISVPGS